MSILFESSDINGMKLANRFVRSATWEGMASPEGEVTQKLIDTMTALARGGVGLIISGHTYIRQEGQASPWQLGVYKDAFSLTSTFKNDTNIPS
jgi:2,4-dienoyl-CoA reductase-like NADH-dependent reductase (Old Yellow Enzyme family)